MIYGERIRLRAPERTDIPLFIAWFNDPEVRNGLALFLPLSTAEEEKWFDGMLARDASEHPLTIEAREGENWKPIGNCGFQAIEWRCHSTEVGIVIGEKAYWNRGYGTEAMRLMLKHGFETLNLNRIWLRVHEDNLGAIRAYEKAGYVHEGRFRQAEFKDGCYKDVLCMSVLRSEWKG
jgi:diamine N-acetyltransferase